MSNLADKLRRLLALATLREGEEGDGARENEARNAAALLLRTCQREGVRIQFVLPRRADPELTHEVPFWASSPHHWPAPTGHRVLMRCRFTAPCKACGALIVAGELMYWAGVKGASHVACGDDCLR